MQKGWLFSNEDIKKHYHSDGEHFLCGMEATDDHVGTDVDYCGVCFYMLQEGATSCPIREVPCLEKGCGWWSDEHQMCATLAIVAKKVVILGD